MWRGALGLFALCFVALAIASEETGTVVTDWKTNIISPEDLDNAAKVLNVVSSPLPPAPQSPSPSPVASPSIDAAARAQKLSKVLEQMEQEEQMKKNCREGPKPIDVYDVPPIKDLTPQEKVPLPEIPVMPPKVPRQDITVTENDLARNCGQHASCDSCLDLLHKRAGSGCGWCADIKTCMAGRAEGPVGDPRIFNCTHWDFGFCSGEPCKTYTSCYQCVQDPFCGWCAESALCTEGTHGGPLFGWCETWQPHTDLPGEQCGDVRERFPKTHVNAPIPRDQVMNYEGI